MVILDIDQDFLFDYIDDGELSYDNFKQIYTIQEIIEKYNAFDKPYKIFVHHHEAYHEIMRLNEQIFKLIHIDRHDDFDRVEYTSYKDNTLHIGNWISHLINKDMITTIDWINHELDYQVIQSPITNENKTIPMCVTKLKDHVWNGNVDMVFFTLSPRFCGNDNSLLEFVNIMNKGYYQKTPFI